MGGREFHCFIAMAVVLLGAVAYVNTFDGEWVWDDASSVLLHEHVQEPGKILQLFREDQHAFGRGAGNFYRPLLSATFMLDFLLSYDPARDADPGGAYPKVRPLVFHVSSLLWHVAAALLLLLVLIKLEAPVFVRAMVPLLYVAHPLHTEAVAYISGRADMMSAAFMFAGLCFALSKRRRALGWILCGWCSVAALLSKESAFVFPGLAGLLMFLPPLSEEEKTNWKRAYTLRSIPFVLACLVLGVYLLLRMTVLKFADQAPGVVLPWGERLVQVCQAFALYIKVLFVPTGLHMEQSLDGAPGWLAWAGAGLLLGCVCLALWAWQAGHWRITMGLGWFLGCWFPISGVLPLNAPMAEHWMYVPMAGFWWAMAEGVWLAARGSVPRKVSVAGAFALCLFFLGLTVQRNDDWHSNERLFRATLKENPASTRVQYNLAVSYDDLLGNLSGARRHYETVLEHHQRERRRSSEEGGRRYLTPEEVDVHLSLGRVLEQQGDYARAAQHFVPVTGLASNQAYRGQAAMAAMGMGRCLLAMGDINRAQAYFGQAQQAEPRTLREIEALLLGAPLDAHR